MRTKSLVLTIGLLLLWVTVSAAQEHPNVAKGIAAGSGFGTADIDAVNPFNGNLALRLPVGQSYPVNAGLSYQLGLVYNSQVWEHQLSDESTVAIPARASNAGLGWSLHLGRLNPPQLESSSSPDFNRNTYLAPDGSLHTFYPKLHEDDSSNADPDPGVDYTRDGTYLRLKTAGQTIELPDGSIHTFSSLNNGYLTRIEDRFGNFVRVEYLDCSPSCIAVEPSSAHTWKISDTQGRTHWISLRDTGQPYQARVITQVDLQAFGGSRAIYKFLYNDSTDDQSTNGIPVGLTGCGGSASSGSNHSVWFLTRLVLPDGSFYDLPKSGYFAYDAPGDFTNPCTTGLINRIRLPTLGFVEWDYILYKYSSGSTLRAIWQKSTGVGFRRLLDAGSSLIGQWSYATVLNGGATTATLLTNSVTDPLGNKVARYFSICAGNCSNSTDGPYEYGLPVARDLGGDGAGRFLSAQVFDAGGALQRSVYVRFEHDLPSASSSVQERRRLNQRLASQRTVFNDDPAGTYADATHSDFDGLGHYRHQAMSGNFPGSNEKASHVQYNPAVGTYGQAGYAPWPAGLPWVLSTYQFNWDQENGQTQYRTPCFEPATGFLLRHRVLKNSGGAESPNDLLQVFQRDGAGNMTNEFHYGGDTQSLPSNACGLTPPASAVYRYTHSYAGGVRAQTTVQVGTILKPLDLTIDSSTGLPSAGRDTAGKQTFFSYDLFGRLTKVSPANDLLTTYAYCTATSVPACAGGVRAEVVTARKATAAGAEVMANRQRFDDWGRLISEADRMPPSGSYVARSTTYNSLGWKTFVSERGSASGTTFSSFDAFGRALTITPADGANHNVTVSYQGVRQIARTVKVATSTAGEAGATTTEVYDRYGRLYQVTEPNGTITRYDYDVGNRLSKVCQGATGAGTATCGQRRLFTYDLRGFLLSEQHPEKGSSGNGLVSYFNYDARGHVGRRVDGPNDLTFTYDVAERLNQIRETAGAQRLLKTFAYATQNGTDASGLTDWRKGKLQVATRYNYPLPAYTVQVDETYTYAGPEGRISKRDTVANTVTSTATTTSGAFTQSFAYDTLGLPSSITYPVCTHAECTQQQPAVFADVPVGHPDQLAIEAIYKAGVTAGCAATTPPYYCPNDNITRAQMAVFLIAASTPGYSPPACTTPTFADVPCSYWAARWIEELYRRGITAGCGGGNFCPENLVTNAEMAVFLLRSKQGASYVPPACTFAPFNDVPCSHWAAPWIAEAARRQIMPGCGGGNFCPDAPPITRAQMAGLLTRGFDIPIATNPNTQRTVQLAYTQGLLTSVTSGATTYGTLSYHPNQMVSQVFHGNGMTETQGNDPNAMRRPSSLAASGPYASWSSGAYGYDGAGNVKTIGSSWFTYDKLSRVTAGTVFDGATGGGNPKQQTYTFDSFGNLTAIGGSPGRNIPTDSTTNRLSSPGTSYDAAGNLKTWNGAATYEYDSFNQMTRMTSGGEDWIYMYTAGDERIWSYNILPNFSRWTVRDLGGKVLRLYHNDQGRWSLGTDYVYRSGLLLAAETQLGRRHFHLDHLGTPRLITRGSGYPAAYHVYLPFGEEATAFNQDTERMKLTGHERDLASLGGTGDDLDYMHARHYSPLTGRFLSTDRMRGYASAPQSWNRYNYARNNSLTFVDPDGQEAIPSGFLRFYNQYFGHDFSNVNLQTGRLGSAVTQTFSMIGGPKLGVTLGNQVFLAPSVVQQLRSSSPGVQAEALSLIGHELVHVQSYEALGGFFLLWYGFDMHYAFTTGTPIRDLAEAPKLEKIGYAAENDINREIARYYTWASTEICTETGDCSTEVNWYLDTQDPFSEPWSHGYQYGFSTYDLFLSGVICIEGICL